MVNKSTRAVVVSVVAVIQSILNSKGSNTGKEHHKSVNHTLNQGHGYHVPICHVGHFVSKYSFNLVSIHLLKKTGRDSDKGIILRWACSEGIYFTGMINSHFRHFFNSCLLRKK